MSRIGRTKEELLMEREVRINDKFLTTVSSDSMYSSEDFSNNAHLSYILKG